jgi:phosphatidylglycerophosphate synthase
MFVVWIDAAHGAGERVFGLTLLERHLKGLKHRKVQPGEVVIDLGASQKPEPEEAARRWPFPVRVVRTAGTIAQRLAKSAVGRHVLVLDAQTLIDARLYDFVTAQPRDLAVEDGSAAMAWIADPTALAPDAADLRSALPPKLPRLTQAEFPGFIRNLRRTLPFYLFRVTNAEERAKVERFLFWSNYKGSTDFLTRFVFPPFVWAAVRPLARLGVHPNWVTGLAVLLCFGAIPLWAHGHWALGFAAAYVMAVLDSVDGKLARLTFTASTLGNVMDHGTDILHPPFWYAAWAWGLAGGPRGPVYALTLWMFGLYALDRLVAPIFRAMTQKSIHGYAPIDVAMRTFISRRNVNLPVFTVALPLGLGAEAIVLVVTWQAVCFGFHAVRCVQVALSLPRGAGSAAR